MNIFCSLKRYCALLCCSVWLLMPLRVIGQEIDAIVTVDRSQINNTSLNFLDNLSDEIETYLNDHTWTDADFRATEQIKVNIQLTLLSVDDNFNFDAQIIFRSQRPVYNTTRETVLFFYNEENWRFTYTPNRSLIHDRLQYDNFTTLLDFYAYLILGYDFDSFEEFGGTPYFSEAQNIVSVARSAASNGWERRGLDQRNRTQLITNLLSSNYRGLRSAIYQYHRKGLDRFVDNSEEARQQILEALQKIQEAKRNTSSNLLFDTFFNAKYREIGSIFKDANPDIKTEAYNLLSDIDPSHLSEYKQLQ